MDETPNPSVQPPLQAPTGDAKAKDIEVNKDLAAISYVWVVSIFLYFWKKDSPFVHFHAKQGLTLFIISLLAWPIPVLGKLLELVVLGYCVAGFLAAAQGEYKVLPIIGQLSTGDMKGARAAWREVLNLIVSLWRRVKKPKIKVDTPTPPAPTPPASPNPPTPPTPPSPPQQ